MKKLKTTSIFISMLLIIAIGNASASTDTYSVVANAPGDEILLFTDFGLTVEDTGYGSWISNDGTYSLISDAGEENCPDQMCVSSDLTTGTLSYTFNPSKDGEFRNTVFLFQIWADYWLYGLDKQYLQIKGEFSLFENDIEIWTANDFIWNPEDPDGNNIEYQEDFQMDDNFLMPTTSYEGGKSYEFVFKISFLSFYFFLNGISYAHSEIYTSGSSYGFLIFDAYTPPPPGRVPHCGPWGCIE